MVGVLAALFMSAPAQHSQQNQKTTVAAVNSKGGSIPSPKQYFGFDMGATGELQTWDQATDYLRLIGDRSNLVTYTNFAKTSLGNDYPYVLVSSAKNLGNIKQIMADNAKLSDPRGLSAKQAQDLAKKTVPVVYVEGTIHSTEEVGTPSIINAIYRLATEKSDFTNRVLNNTVMLFVPSQNPDGQMLVNDYFNQTADTSYSRIYPDLYSHYAGHDDNRDWYQFNLPESRAREQLFEMYHPVYQELIHQDASNAPRLYTAPYEEPLGNEIDPNTIETAGKLGLSQAEAMTAVGDTGVGHGNSYGVFWTADVADRDSYTGSSILINEIAQLNNLVYPVTSTNGKPLACGPISDQANSMDCPNPYNSTTWTFEQAVKYTDDAIYGAVDEVAKDPQTYLYNNLYTVASDAMTWTGGPYAYVVPANQRDPYAVYQLLSTLDFSKVEINQATAAFSANGKTYPAGSWVIKVQQPLGRYASEILNVDQYPDVRACSTCPLIFPYSEMTDNLPMELGVTVDSVKTAFDAPLKLLHGIAPAKVTMPPAPATHGAYLVDPNSYGIASFLSALQSANLQTFRTAAQFTSAGHTFAPGTIVIPPSGQARSVLQKAAAATGIPVYASNQTPQVQGFALKPGTKVGLIRGLNQQPGGWLEYMMDEYHVNWQAVTHDDYADLGQFDTIILGDGVSQNTIQNGLNTANYPPDWAWAAGAGATGWSELHDWVTGGGNLIALGSASTTAQQLLGLPMQNVRTSAVNVPGSDLRATYDPTVPAAWGMPQQWPVWYDNNPAWKITDTTNAQVASSYPNDSSTLLASGYESGSDALKGASNIATFKVGNGQATIAGTDLNFRAWTKVDWLVVANMIYQGPSKPVSATQMVSQPSFATLSAH
ncbi:M14 family zinc carboxypeptidase [Rugosimonospora acidiphila]|uniref:M14 family zinc carboxypeptidase n=1 Tax=Rugosimonospora acidiphila TaxID=556531 RepID=UPI0031ECE63A